MIHENSTKSYEEQKEKGSVDCWRKLVFDVYSMNPHKSFTDREVINILGATDVNLVRPEISRLVGDGLVEQVGKTMCVFSSKTVRHCSWNGGSYFSRGNKNRGLND